MPPGQLTVSTALPGFVPQPRPSATRGAAQRVRHRDAGRRPWKKPSPSRRSAGGGHRTALDDADLAEHRQPAAPGRRRAADPDRGPARRHARTASRVRSSSTMRRRCACGTRGDERTEIAEVTATETIRSTEKITDRHGRRQRRREQPSRRATARRIAGCAGAVARCSVFSVRPPLLRFSVLTRGLRPLRALTWTLTTRFCVKSSRFHQGDWTAR